MMGSVQLTLLDPATEARLRAAELTYPEVGQSAGALPSGYATFSLDPWINPIADLRAVVDHDVVIG
jgi:hypothetical protein